ncbi:hypothetical protein H4R33_002660 [Dimargaris cristalligena]|uniref:Alpha/Beta hydrolase protein n=1 Tax=Dimargaris cristalligena TaxID=215637 RepID=A0A4Q0A1Y1_9FUNG|nr:hypothetical protein H4R33_002660 [Dimargaris cristalligena]RKP39312.1 Alpha/Beta hydrolase protein [Dimargaris cristalligena]|eukprot:RKP39312.1 Alpha/Beta hydrolase protein [Dimargaris cristalligena]
MGYGLTRHIPSLGLKLSNFKDPQCSGLESKPPINGEDNRRWSNPGPGCTSEATWSELLERPGVPQDAISKYKKYLNYAFAAYLPEAEMVSQLRLDPTLDPEHIVPFPTKFNNACYGFVARDSTGGNIYVVHRGSTSNALSTYYYDLQGKRVPWRKLSKFVGVHRGIKTVHTKCFPLWKPILEEQLEGYPKAKVNLIGHSLGGALSVTGALELFQTVEGLKSRLRVFTFGAPPVGNRAFNLVYNKTKIPTIRITSGYDKVPNLKLRGRYTHVRGEHYITPDGKRTFECFYNENTLAQDPECIAKVSWFNFKSADHNNYWGIKEFIPYNNTPDM